MNDLSIVVRERRIKASLPEVGVADVEPTAAKQILFIVVVAAVNELIGKKYAPVCPGEVIVICQVLAAEVTATGVLRTNSNIQLPIQVFVVLGTICEAV